MTDLAASPLAMRRPMRTGRPGAAFPGSSVRRCARSSASRSRCRSTVDLWTAYELSLARPGRQAPGRDRDLRGPRIAVHRRIEVGQALPHRVQPDAFSSQSDVGATIGNDLSAATGRRWA